MNRLALAALICSPFMLAACSEAEPEDMDTSYEEQLPAPVEDAGNDMSGVPDNDTIEGGRDEQVDARYSGDNQLPENTEVPE